MPKCNNVGNVHKQLEGRGGILLSQVKNKSLVEIIEIFLCQENWAIQSQVLFSTFDSRLLVDFLAFLLS